MPLKAARSDMGRLWAAGVLGFYGVIYVIHALAPEIQPDGYTYHLGLAREYARIGWFPDRVGFYEMLPQGLEILFALAYALGGQAAAKLVHFAFLAATVPLIFAVARRLGLEAWHGYVASILYFCAPVTGIAGTSAYNDAALVFFTLAAFYALLAGHAFSCGLLAGCCYAVKPTGLAIVAGVLLYFVARRSWRSAALAVSGAALMIAPWMVRNALVTGNPMAPLLNGVFPNPYFHIAEEETLATFFRSYGDVTARAVPLELTIRGNRLQGLLGPIFLLSPLALLALRHKAGRIILGAAVIAGAPWFLNIGARFLMPALAFLSLALAIAVPRRLVWTLAAAHAITSLPWALDLYSEPYSWRLRGFPWRAALRLQDERGYLRSRLVEYPRAELVSARLVPGTPFLDLAGAPAAYTDAKPVEPWHAARPGRAFDALRIASSGERWILQRIEARWPEREIDALRIVLAAAPAGSWSIQEVELAPARNLRWSLDAGPNPWEAALAFDRNP
ncbi:MAG: ArnT family glycosyltransferase, partial [Bryobacteraceae bacterium]